MSAIDIRVLLEPQIAWEHGPLGLRIGWGTLRASALDIRLSLEPQIAQEAWTFRLYELVGGRLGVSAPDIRV